MNLRYGVLYIKMVYMSACRLVLGVFLLVFLVGACSKEAYYVGDDVQISFSKDTLRFDTVFTTLGSATRFIKIYNRNNQPIQASISLAEGGNSFFRINADGTPGPEVSNVEIGAGDSIYVFAEVTIDPNQPLTVSPFIIQEQLVVKVNGREFKAMLEAWGQNANYLPSSDGKGGQVLLSCDFKELVWDDSKPYVIYGILYIDECTLIWPPGTRIYVHGGVVRNENSIYNDGMIVFLENGRLKSRGTAEKPVSLEGDRLESEFKDVSSQWNGVLFWKQSKENELTHTRIKNSIFGVRADSLSKVSLSSCIISNTGGPGIIGRYSDIYAENCLLFDNNSFGMQLTYGGNYTFNYCTVASYTGNREAVLLTDFYCNDPLCLTGIKLNPLKARFTNCILTGGDQDEIALGRFSTGVDFFDYEFNHCGVRVKELLEPKSHPDFFENCVSCVDFKPGNKVFKNTFENDFSLDSMSVMLGKGIPIPSILHDIKRKTRKSPPDPGCYEL
jgi:hypothetical protein